MATVSSFSTQKSSSPVSRFFRSRVWRRLAKRKSALFGLCIVLFMVFIAIFAPILAPYDPIAQSWTAVRKAPSLQHLFGTDEAGRDILARILYGARASLLAGLTSVGIAMAIGVPLGLAAGFIGGFVDGLISRFTDAMLACPFLILAIALAAFLGQASPMRCWPSASPRPRCSSG